MITEREESAGKPTNSEAQLPIRKAFMTRDDIFRIAVQAGARPSLSPELWDFWNIRNADLERFAALVVAHERQWVGLTDEEIKSLPSWWPSYEDAPALVQLVKDVEAKLREKNEIRNP